jgi:hypothetical protein
VKRAIIAGANYLLPTVYVGSIDRIEVRRAEDRAESIEGGSHA